MKTKINLVHEKKVSSLEERLRLANQKNKELLKELTKTERDLDLSLNIQRSTKTFTIIKKTGGNKGEVTPILLASDWHCEEKVESRTVNGLNHYDIETARKRAFNFFENAAKLIERERRDQKMTHIVLALLGDFISGNIHTPLLPICQLQPMDAILLAQELIMSGILFLRKETKLDIIIPATVGNHSRTTDKVWIATENGYSLEYMMYKNMEQFLKKDSHIRWNIAMGQHQYLEIYGKNLRFLHGTQFRYQQGIGGFTIPIMKKIQKWDASIPAYYTFCGHLHQLFDGNPRFIVNGSMIGYNTFAMSIGAEYQKPLQSMVIMSKKYGKAGVSPIFLDS